MSREHPSSRWPPGVRAVQARVLFRLLTWQRGLRYYHLQRVRIIQGRTVRRMGTRSLSGPQLLTGAGLCFGLLILLLAFWWWLVA